MARPPSTHPTDGELEILRVLWDRGPLPLGEICAALRRERTVATTTVATMLGVMLEKRLVKRKQSSRAAEWAAAVTRDAAAKSMVGKLIDGVFAGSAGLLAQHLVEDGKLSTTELTDLKRLIEEESARQGAKTQRKPNNG